MSRQDNSDPLPFVQVDRAIAQDVARLASHMSLVSQTTVSNQHALGSLVGFWNMCGDPRELEAIVSATGPDEEPEVILSADEVVLRFQLASDVKVEPLVLARLHILEERPEGFRVRGMSRFFDPIKRRLQARKAASMGGKASVAARKAASGTAQPRSGVGSTVAQAALEATPKRSRTLEVRGQRSEGIGHRQEDDPPPVAAFEIQPPDLEQVDAWTKEDFWKAAEVTRRSMGYPPQKWPSPVALSRWWGESRGIADVRELAQAFTRFASDKHWKSTTPPAPFAGFMSQWSNFLPQRNT